MNMATITVGSVTHEIPEKYKDILPKAILSQGKGTIEWAINLLQSIENAKASNKNLNAENLKLQKESKAYKAEVERLNKAIPHLAERMCGGKKAYYTKAQAQAVVDRFGGRFYMCPTCACFHHTTKKTIVEKAGA